MFIIKKKTETWDVAHISSKEFLDNQAIIEFGFSLKHVGGMIRTYSQLYLYFFLLLLSPNIHLSLPD